MNVQYFRPDQLEGQLAELPEVVSGELALLVVVGQRLGRNTPDKENRFNTSQVVFRSSQQALRAGMVYGLFVA